MKKIIILLLVMSSVYAQAQLLTWTPQFATDASTINITMDATKGNQGLMGSAGPVYMHLGVITNLSTGASDWKHVTTTWGTTTGAAATAAGTNKWTFTLTNPRTYFSVPAGETILKVVLLFRNAAGTQVQRNADGTDMFIPIYASATGNNILITKPNRTPTYSMGYETLTPTVGASVPVTAVAAISGNLSLSLNGSSFATTTGTTISGNAIAVAGNNQVIASLNGSAFDTLNFYIAGNTTIKDYAAGLNEGINYYGCTDSATVILFAPNKSRAMLIGDFSGSNWLPQTQFQMNKTTNGNYYWYTVHGLTSGTEYAYQYIVDDTIYIADPYAEKFLDPWNDKYISTLTYPNLKAYPTNSNVSSGKNGFVSVLQTCAPQYNWDVTNFVKPDKRNLMIYELLVRDFSARKTTYSVCGNYQDVLDSLPYLKKLGINAVEFMPLEEFSGNDGWGYNPEYHFAADKAYGTKNKLKELIDSLHKNGIAVLLDVVWDDLASTNDPQAKLYWNNATGYAASNNPWLNPYKESCPYGVFQNGDINHSSSYTQSWVEKSLEYWINEFKVDGFRFDLAKGFSNSWLGEGVYDAARVANLERYYDYIEAKHPNTYMILEFLGGLPCAEEQEYVRHGFMCWGEMWSQYTQCSMGYSSSNDIGPIVWNYGSRNYASPSLVGYPESHDKERMMYQNEKYGNASGSYNVKTLATGLERMEAVGATLFTVPGPKMIWQFEERGYDSSIGSNGGNTADKLPMWNYMNDPNRKHLYDAWSKMIQFRLANPAVFNNAPFYYDYNTDLIKVLSIGDPDTSKTQVLVVANFDVNAQTKTLNFFKKGVWTNLISNTGVGTLGSGINGATGTKFSISNTTQTILLQPGEYHIYVISYTNALPLNLISFTGQSCHENVCLNWVTANEVDVQNIVVENSSDSKTFNELTTLNALNGAGNNYYNFEDKHPFAGNNYYRLKVINKDGTFSYSQIVKVEFNIAGVEVSPNPARNFISVHANENITGIEMINEQGEVIKKYALAGNINSTLIPAKEFPAGLYFVRIATTAGMVTKQIIIAR